MTDNSNAPHPKPTQAEDGDLDGFRKDVSDIIEFPQLPKGHIATRDLRGQPMSSTELGYKVSLITERLLALKSTWQAEVRRELLEKS